jgi:RNA polymerase primary sigma factor
MTEVKRRRRRVVPAGIAPSEPERDILDQYLYEVSTYPLLKGTEELELARKIRAGDQDSLQELVKRNLRFVISVAKKYQNRGLPLIDLIGEGNVGLLTAARKFDPDQGVKFISYAVWWVRQAVLKALAEQTRSVRIPLNQNSALIRMGRAETILSQVLKRDPTDAELATLLEETPEDVRAARQLTTSEVSLDAPVDRGDRDASTFGERFTAEADMDIEETTDSKLMREQIDRALRRHLTPRERKILYLYYGLDESAEAMTLERIGELLGVTRERIRQIRERAFEKLRESPEGNALAGFWNVA